MIILPHSPVDARFSSTHDALLNGAPFAMSHPPEPQPLQGVEPNEFSFTFTSINHGHQAPIGPFPLTTRRWAKTSTKGWAPSSPIALVQRINALFTRFGLPNSLEAKINPPHPQSFSIWLPTPVTHQLPWLKPTLIALGFPLQSEPPSA